MIIIIISWIVFAIVVGAVAQSMGRSFGSYFALSLLISPLISFIILAIKGRMTIEEKLDSESHIVYCINCKQAFGSSPNKVILNCPDCGNRLLETKILRDDWRGYSYEQKEKMKRAFEKGEFMRYEADSMLTNKNNNNAADEIKKYKELLDMGAISVDEFETKKHQLLDI